MNSLPPRQGRRLTRPPDDRAADAGAPRPSRAARPAPGRRVADILLGKAVTLVLRGAGASLVGLATFVVAGARRAVGLSPASVSALVLANLAVLLLLVACWRGG